MITNNGQYVYSDYKRLEKSHGPDRAIGILNRIRDELDKEFYIQNPKYSKDDVRKRSLELYEQILNDMKNDEIHVK